MKNVKLKFTVSTNANLYYATSLKAITSFCNKHNFTVTNWYGHIPTVEEKISAVKCGRGIWGIINNTVNSYYSLFDNYV